MSPIVRKDGLYAAWNGISDGRRSTNSKSLTTAAFFTRTAEYTRVNAGNKFEFSEAAAKIRPINPEVSL